MDDFIPTPYELPHIVEEMQHTKRWCWFELYPSDSYNVNCGSWFLPPVVFRRLKNGFSPYDRKRFPDFTSRLDYVTSALAVLDYNNAIAEILSND